MSLPTIILPGDNEPGRVVGINDWWPEVEAIEREDFNDAMPTSLRQSSFLAAMDGDTIAAYLRAEHLYHGVHVWERPEYRNRAGLARQLMAEFARNIPGGFSGVWLTRKRYPHLAKILTARELGQFWVYRRDN